MMRYIHNLWLILLLVFLAFTAMFSNVKEFLGSIEGSINPVIDPTLTITEYTELDTASTQLEGTATKVRDCNFVTGSLKWYLGDPERFVEVPAFFKDKPQVRDTGILEWEAIVVGLPAEEISRKSFSTVEHDCGWPWPTISLLFISPEESE